MTPLAHPIKLYRPELLYIEGRFVSNSGVYVSESGKILAPQDTVGSSLAVIELPGKVILPGFVNAHSHSFQRLIRGKSESRRTSGKDFWTWRGTMYHAASRLQPQDVYDVARMAFLEMLLAGTTTVGEFHYVHNDPNGKPYDDPNLLAKQVIAAAQSVGIRIALLRTSYQRSGFEVPTDQGQARFFESGKAFLQNMKSLLSAYAGDVSGVSFGIAPHSVRAVPLGDLKEIAEWNRQHHLPFHMHVSEQVAENTACLREYGVSPVELLHREHLLGPNLTAVHAIHITAPEIDMLAAAEVTICSCPTTERNLGDGIFPADRVLGTGIRIAFGSDSQAQIDPLEDARELEYHLRLQQQERAILEPMASTPLAESLLDAATIHGARSLALDCGELTPGAFADFFTVNLNDLSIAGHSPEDLLPILIFSLNRSAICDVVVNGKFVVRDKVHVQQGEIVSQYNELHRKVWQESGEANRNL